MKNWNDINNDKLHSLVLDAAKSEKSATLILLEHLAEIDRRRLYAEKSFPSLWVYVHEYLGYSEAQTSERVSSMRLMAKVPEVKSKIENGSISLTAIAKLASHVRREQIGNSETLSLLNAISGKPTREVEQLLAKNATIEYKTDKIKAVTATSTRIIIDVDHEFLALMNRARELKGYPGISTQDLLKFALQSLVKKHSLNPKTEASRTPSRTAMTAGATPLPDPSTKTPNRPIQERTVPGTSIIGFSPRIDSRPIEATLTVTETHSSLRAPEVDHAFRSRYIPISIRNKIRFRSRDQCEYIDQQTGIRCKCKTKLEFDHIIPYAEGGLTRIENLRLYCSAHNRFSAIQYFGLEHMQRYFKN